MTAFLYDIPQFIGDLVNWFVGAVIMTLVGIILAQVVIGRAARWLRRRGWIT